MGTYHTTYGDLPTSSEEDLQIRAVKADLWQFGSMLTKLLQFPIILHAGLTAAIDTGDCPAVAC